MGEEHGLTPVSRTGRLERAGQLVPVRRGGELERRDRQAAEPGWPTVIATTIRLWLERHRAARRTSGSGGRRILVTVLAAVLAMGLGAGVTAALTEQKPVTAQPRTGTSGSLQAAAAVRDEAANWIARQVSPAATLECDPTMCSALQASGIPAARLLVLQPSDFDPLGATVIVATQVVRNQFGARLASVYAPLVIASFGSGANRIDIRAVAPEGSAAFESQLASDLQARITAGRYLLHNKNVQATAAARQALLTGDVDPRLLVTLSALAYKMRLVLIAFDDSSPGASPDVPLRGAEIGAAASTGLSAMLAFLAAQQTTYQPAQDGIVRLTSGQSAVSVRFDAPGPMGLNGP